MAFFLFAGVLTFLSVGSYLFKQGFQDLVADVREVAETSAVELRSRPATAAAAWLEQRRGAAASRLPGLSMALVPVDRPGGEDVPREDGRIAVGPWTHLDALPTLPSWAGEGSRGVLLAYRPDGDDGETTLVIRAVSPVGGQGREAAVIVDLPVAGAIAERLRESTGVEFASGDVVAIGDVDVQPAGGGVASASDLDPPPAPASSLVLNWVTFFDFTDWESGRTGQLGLSTRVSLVDIYQRVSAAQSLLGNVSVGDLFLVALGVIATMFLIIEFAALVMGFTLARSITGAVHALFLGTQRVRRGDFTYRIPIRNRDQLGELAESFNSMTANMEGLLQQAAEKRRLEEELRIARQIQMTLLPRGSLSMSGVAVTALCVPAREVGGDYYDFFRLSDHRVGFLVADVSGKGVSAALYMAELKGLVLSLCEIHQSPRELLIEANRMITGNLGTSSFITMTYAVLDLQARTFTHARAGHTPLIHVPDATAASGGARMLMPDGMVLGLGLPGIGAIFDGMLEESCIPIATGDIFVLYTDGITEAMNAESDLFGEDRLSRIVEEHGHLQSEELRERIVREVESFVDGSEQHDDMTMVLLKIEEGAPAAEGGQPASSMAAPEFGGGAGVASTPGVRVESDGPERL